MPSDSYEVGVVDRHGDQTLRRTCTADELRDFAARLKRQNALGSDVFIRPASTDYILLDGLPVERLTELTGKGLQPALVTEVAPGNYQAWIRFPERLPESERRLLGRAIAHQFGADPDASDWRHLGRLPGFINHKSDSGLQPLVLVHEAAGVVCDAGQSLVDWARERLEAIRFAAEERRRLAAIEVASEPSRGADAGSVYRHHARTMSQCAQAAGQPVDWSNVDYAAAKIMIETGFPPDEIERAMLEDSPHVEIRNKERGDEYATLT
ncbi:MAG: hypothetical protein HQL38_18680, partial [Alphaproteobacteria bacterium]|nr:hypothetical protein [Alphaproteobacteria bacterium]